MNLMHQFFKSTELFAFEAIFSFIHIFVFEKYLNFWGFLSVPHSADNYTEIVEEQGGTLGAIAHYRASLFILRFK